MTIVANININIPIETTHRLTKGKKQNLLDEYIREEVKRVADAMTIDSINWSKEV